MSQNTPRVCVNGHQSRDAAAKFCITCGATLGAATTAPPPADKPNFQPPPAAVAPPIRPPAALPNQMPPNAGNYPPPNQYPPQFPQANYPPPQFQPPPQPPPPNAGNYPPQYPPHANQLPPGNWGQYPPQFPPQPPPNYQRQYPPPQYLQPVPPRPIKCQTCGDDGSRLNEKIFICPECRWLRPLAPGYALDPSAFQWAEDGKAMSALRSVGALNSAAKSISSRVGRRWIEVTFNGVLLSEKQLPDIYFQAVRAARILGMSHMPDVYISGECAWECHTYGSADDAFVIIGSALAGSFQGVDLSFLLAREMGRVRAGHALWKSVLRFLVGEAGNQKGVMAGGILNALNPMTLLESAIEVPLLSWARQAEITADRAGMLAVGDEEVARRVLLSWSLKSAFLYRRINVAAWLEQQGTSDDGAMKLSELMTTSTPYITRRLALMTEFAKSQELAHWRAIISRYAPPLPTAPPRRPPPRPANAAPPKSGSAAPPPAALNAAPNAVAPPKPAPKKTAGDEINLKCAACATAMRVPKTVLQGKTQIGIRCPNKQCGKVMTVKQKRAAAPVRRKPEEDFTE